jgi:hypothetical protein
MNEGWQCQLRFLYGFERVAERWFWYDPLSLHRIEVDHDPMTWWRPTREDPIDF